MLRALRHYWRINLAVVVAVAVNSAVLTGALLVGDSVRGSLADLTLDRLGKIELAVVAERFFREELAEELATELTADEAPAPKASMQASTRRIRNPLDRMKAIQTPLLSETIPSETKLRAVCPCPRGVCLAAPG